LGAVKVLQKKSDRIQLIDKIIERKKEIKFEKEKFQYYKLRHALEYIKRKFLKKINKDATTDSNKMNLFHIQ